MDRAGEILSMDDSTGLDTCDILFLFLSLGLLITRVFTLNCPR